MDIMELGAIGELVGGVAVVGSLLFVGPQIRQSNRLAGAEAVRSYTREFAQSVLTPLSEPAMAERVHRGMNDFSDLQKREQIVVHAQWMKIMMLGQTNFILRRDNMMREDFASAYELADLSFLKTRGGAAWWSGVRPGFIPDYVEHIDRQLASNPVPPLTEILEYFGGKSSMATGA